MPIKINIAEKEKSWKLEIDSERLFGKSIGDKIQGSEISPNLAGYEFEIRGGTDNSGFAHKKEIAGSALKRVLLSIGWGMHKRPKKEGKKRVSTPRGLRLRKTVRGKELSEKTVQVNLTIVTTGNKSLKEIFPDQNKIPEKEQPTATPSQESSIPSNQ